MSITPETFRQIGGNGMERYLLYDGGCSTCSSLAREVAAAVGDSMGLLSLGDERARGYLDEVYPQGWQYRPYVVEVGVGGVRAHGGWPAYLRLAFWMGPGRALRIWRMLGGRLRVRRSSRRGFLRQAGASLAGLLFLSGRLAAHPPIEGGVDLNAGHNPSGSCDRCGRHCNRHLYSYCAAETCTNGARHGVAFYEAHRHGVFNGYCCGSCGWISEVFPCAC